MNLHVVKFFFLLVTFGAPAEKTGESKGRYDEICLSECNSYKIYRSDGKTEIQGSVFVRNEMVNNKRHPILYIYFRDIKNSKSITQFVTIATSVSYIGLPERGAEMNVANGKLCMTATNLVFTPINIQDINQMIFKFYISDTLIYFDNFLGVKDYGDKIIVKKMI